MTAVLAWHFTRDTLRDGRPIPAIGETLVHEGPVEICASGLHASEDAFDALRYAPGAMLHRVRCEDVRDRQDDKLVCTRRTIIASRDATQMLRRFAADRALGVAHLWDMPDIAREYLTTLDDGLRDAARDAAWDAARDAARDAAWDAARATARDAARDAAWATARDAARAARAARDAAWATARAAARRDFNARVDALFEGVE